MAAFIDQVIAEETRHLGIAVGFASIVYFLAVVVIFEFGPSLNKTGSTAAAPILEAELVNKAELDKLFEKKPEPIQPKVREQAISKKVGNQKDSAEKMKELLDQKNQTVAAPADPPTRGPVVMSSPAPKLPTYLKDQGLKATVLIEFFVAKSGSTSVSLVGSSGNEELDALAIRTAKLWQFRPALKDGEVADAKIRLRINFEVE